MKKVVCIIMTILMSLCICSCKRSNNEDNVLTEQEVKGYLEVYTSRLDEMIASYNTLTYEYATPFVTDEELVEVSKKTGMTAINSNRTYFEKDNNEEGMYFPIEINSKLMWMDTQGLLHSEDGKVSKTLHTAGVEKKYIMLCTAGALTYDKRSGKVEYWNMGNVKCSHSVPSNSIYLGCDEGNEDYFFKSGDDIYRLHHGNIYYEETEEIYNNVDKFEKKLPIGIVMCNRPFVEI